MEQNLAILMPDLSGYTALTEIHGSVAAADKVRISATIPPLMRSRRPWPMVHLPVVAARRQEMARELACLRAAKCNQQ